MPIDGKKGKHSLKMLKIYYKKIPRDLNFWEYFGLYEVNMLLNNQSETFRESEYCS